MTSLQKSYDLFIDILIKSKSFQKNNPITKEQITLEQIILVKEGGGFYFGINNLICLYKIEADKLFIQFETYPKNK